MRCGPACVGSIWLDYQMLASRREDNFSGRISTANVTLLTEAERTRSAIQLDGWDVAVDFEKATNG